MIVESAGDGSDFRKMMGGDAAGSCERTLATFVPSCGAAKMMALDPMRDHELDDARCRRCPCSISLADAVAGRLRLSVMLERLGDTEVAEARDHT
jgi:hypothetical protein